MSQDKDEKVKSLINSGSEITGSAVGGALGFVLGGPGGAAAGGALGVMTAKALNDVARRFLSAREEIRVGAAATYAITRIQAYLKDGRTPRSDSFFETDDSNRSKAEEIFEGVLLKAKNEHEEKKIRIIGNIFANVAFVQAFSINEANHLLKIAENLTYRQFCVLALFERKKELNLTNLRKEDYRGIGKITFDTYSLLEEIYELIRMGLVFCQNEKGDGNEFLLGGVDIKPDRLYLGEIGKRYYQMMGLVDVHTDDLLGIVKDLE